MSSNFEKTNITLPYHHLRWNYGWKNYQLPEIDLPDIIGKNQLIQPKITDELCMPPYLGKNDVSGDDIGTLLSIVKAKDPSIVLELGTAHGATVANICEVSPRCKVYTVNALPEQIEGNKTTFSLTKDEIGYVYRKFGYADRVTQIYANTKKMNIADYLPDKSVDLAIIDACHDADFVVSDFKTIFRSLSSNAIVLFHDTHPSLKEHLLDSYIACMHLRMCKYNVCHVRGTWWGIWMATKPFVPNRIKYFELFDKLVSASIKKQSLSDLDLLLSLGKTFK